MPLLHRDGGLIGFSFRTQLHGSIEEDFQMIQKSGNTSTATEKPETALQQRREPSKQSRIVGLLAILGIRRQAKLDPEDYQVFAADLEQFEWQDIESGLTALGHRKREPGETAFPDGPTMQEEIKTHRNTRKAKDRVEAERKAEEEYRAKITAERESDARELQEKIDEAARKFVM